MAVSFPSSPTTGDIYNYNGKYWRYNGTVWLRLGDMGLVNISDKSFRASPDATASFNHGAITDAIAAAAELYTGIYIPGGAFNVNATINMTDDKVVPILGAGKYRSNIFTSGSTIGLLIKPPVDESNNQGHWMQGFSIWPSTPGGGTVGIEVQLRAESLPTNPCYYAYYLWRDIAVGAFGTISLYLNNAIKNTAGFFDGVITDNCVFHNSASLIYVGDSVVVEKSRFLGSKGFDWYNLSGARALSCCDNLFINTGGMLFTNVATMTFARNQCEIVPNFTNAFLTNTQFTVYGVGPPTEPTEVTKPSHAIHIHNNRFAQYGTTKAAIAVAFGGTTNHVRFDNNSVKIGGTTHIASAATTDFITGTQNVWHNASDQLTTTPSNSIGGTNSSMNTT